MNYIERILDVGSALKNKSCFLFGPRQTGKSSLIEHTLPGAKVIDLLDEEIYLRLTQNPTQLREYLSEKDEIVVLDEVQRVPALLNEVHRQIERNKSRRFLLTGSSARKLRKKGVNLLGGRARTRNLHPLVYGELKDKFDANRAFHLGTVPSVYSSDDPWDDLKSYVGTYLKEEIAAEAATRNVPAFARFLETAACCNCAMINYEKISQDAQVPRATVQGYFQILRDTLLGYDLEPWRRTQKRKAIQTSKFYFFDIGIVNYLKRIKALDENSSQFGDSMEAYFFHELKAYCDYKGDGELHYWRSQSGYEVDFLLNDKIGIEIKASRRIIQDDLKGLIALSEDQTLKHQIIVCRESTPRTVQGIKIIPYRLFLEKLWADEFI